MYFIVHLSPIERVYLYIYLSYDKYHCKTTTEYHIPKETIIGRPIKKSWFGTAGSPGSQIIVNGVRWADNTTSTNAYIVKQTGSAAYIVSNGTKSEIAFMVNANGVGALRPNQCFINATPFGGSALPCAKISQFRASIYTVANAVARQVGDPAVQAQSDYSWSALPATVPGQCDLITAAEGGYPVNTVAPAVTGLTVVGSTLTTTDGTWTGNPTITFTYQWTLNGANVGTNANTFVIPAGAAGRLILCKVTATNAVASVVANSNTITTT
jgi:hypothetical protein